MNKQKMIALQRPKFGSSKNRVTRFQRKLRILIGIAVMAVPQAVGAVETSPDVPAAQTLVVYNERGGSILDRIKQIQRIRAQDTNVEIRGQICYSTCTMYIGMPKACVIPSTEFGFHGPSFNGRLMSARDFEQTSRVIASYYPKEISDWYMAYGRTTTRSYFSVTGAQLIGLGVARCS